MKWDRFKIFSGKKGKLNIPDLDEQLPPNNGIVIDEVSILELEKIRQMISDGLGDRCIEDLIEILREYPRDIRVLDLYSRVLHGGHRVIILREMIQNGYWDESYFGEILDYEYESFAKQERRNIEALVIRLRKLFSLIDWDSCNLNPGKIIESIEKQYKINPILGKDLALATYRSAAEFSEVFSLGIFTQLKLNLRDLRIERNAFFSSKRTGNLCLSLDLLNVIEEKDEREYERNSVLNAILDILISGNIEDVRKLTWGSESSSENEDSDVYGILARLSRYSKEIEDFLQESPSKRGMLSSDLLKMLADYIGNNDRDVFTDFGQFTEDLNSDLMTIPLSLIDKRIESHYFELGSPVSFEGDILKFIEERGPNSHRLVEVLLAACSALLEVDSKLGLKFIERAVENYPSDERLVRMLARCYEKSGAIDMALQSLEGCSQPSSLKLSRRYMLFSDILENGLDIGESLVVDSYAPELGKVMYNVHSSVPYVTSGYTVRTEGVSRSILSSDVKLIVNCRWGFPTDKHPDIDTLDVRERETINGVDYIFSPDSNGMNSYRYQDLLEKMSDNLRERVKEEKPSVLISASDYSMGLATAKIAKEFKIPFIYEMRGLWAYSRSANNPGYEGSTEYKILMRLEKQCARSADLLVVISTSMRRIVMEWGVPPERVIVIPNGASVDDLAMPKLSNSTSEAVSEKEEIVFGYVGSMVPYEGLEMLLEAFANLRKRNKNNLFLTMVGDGSSKVYLEKRVEELGINRAVNFTGKIDHSEISSVYESLDCIVIPRKSHPVCEIVPPLKPLEAMKHGKIVLMSDVTPAADLVIPGINGLLFEKDNVDSLENKLEEIQSKIREYREIGEMSSKWVSENRTWDIVCEPLVEILPLFFLHNIANTHSPDIKQIQEAISEYFGEDNFDKIKSKIIINKMENLGFSNLVMRNIFLSFLRGMGNNSSKDALIFSEGLIEKYGDQRSLRSVVTYQNREGRYQDSLNLVRKNKWSDSDWERKIIGELNKRIQRETFKRGVEGEKGKISFDSIEKKFLENTGYEVLTEDKKSAILIYGDINLNIVDGSSIWLSSITELFSKSGVETHLLAKADIVDGILTDHLKKIDNIRIIQPSDFGIEGVELDPNAASKIITILDGVFGGYNSVVLRGFEICNKISNEKNLWKRVWAYLTDYYSISELSGKVLKEDVREFLLDFKHFCGKFIVQTEHIKNDLIELGDVPEDQFIVVPPMLPDFLLDLKEGAISGATTEKRKLKIGYVGKIAPMWGVDTLVRELSKIPNVEDKIEVTIVGSKFNRNTPDRPRFIEETRELLRSSKFVRWVESVPREEALEILSTMDLSWCFRSKRLERETMEVSTKLLESACIQVPPILVHGRINTSMFPNDYPFLLTGEEDIVPLIKSVLKNRKKIDQAREKLPNTNSYFMSNILTEVILSEVEKMKMPNGKKIVLNGHDMKFIGEFESFLKICGHNVRRDNWGWGDPIDIKRSGILAKWGEIIFSEWGLANAVWYSENITDEKTHIIRVHLQEINQRARKFPVKINMSFVDKVVVVADHVREEAVRMFSWDERKTVTIPNLVDVTRLDRPVKMGIGRTLGIVGIVPQRKRVDRALDLICQLSTAANEDWRLIIKGKLPHELPFMYGPSRKIELEYFMEQYERIKTQAELTNSVSFEGYTPTIASFYGKTDFVLSPSDFESFHFTIADGVSSGSIPVIWPWEGSTDIYPEEWVVSSTKEAASRIFEFANMSNEDLNKIRLENKNYIRDNFGLETVFEELFETLGIEIPNEKRHLINSSKN